MSDTRPPVTRYGRGLVVPDALFTEPPAAAGPERAPEAGEPQPGTGAPAGQLSLHARASAILRAAAKRGQAPAA